MEWVEVTGKSVEQAKDRALDLLGVDEAQAEFEVLEEPRISGLLRRLKGEARVRARVKPVTPRPKAERRDRRRGRPTGSGRDVETREPREGVESTGRTREPRATGAGSGTARTERGRERGPRTGGGRTSRPAEAATLDGAEDGDEQERSERPTETVSTFDRLTSDETNEEMGHGRSPERDPGARTVGSREGKSHVQDELDTNEAGDDIDQAADAKVFVEGLLSAFGVPANVTVERVDENLDEVQVTGADLGLLIGPKAATLEAVQELTRVAVQRRMDGRSDTRLRVDIGSYRQRRREALERFALKLAEDVRTSGVQKVLEPMGSADRKVIHDTVGNLDGVRTLSEGEDPRRRVVIVPAG